MKLDKLVLAILPVPPTVAPNSTGRGTQAVDVAAAAARVRKRFALIDRDDLPKVVEAGGGWGTAGHAEAHRDGRISPSTLRATAAEYLALADWVDGAEGSVKRLALALDRAAVDGDPRSRDELYGVARRLIADGWTRKDDS